MTFILTGLYLIIGYAWAELVKMAMDGQKAPLRRWSFLYDVALVFWPLSILLGLLYTLRQKELPR